MIIRRRRNGRYTIVPNGLVEDARLSFEAVGMGAYLLSRPDDWEVRVGQLCSRGGWGRDKGRRVLRELIDAGYVVRGQQRSDDGRRISGVTYFVFDEPLDSGAGGQGPENPAPEPQGTDFQAPDCQGPENPSPDLIRSLTNYGLSPREREGAREGEATGTADAAAQPSSGSGPSPSPRPSPARGEGADTADAVPDAGAGEAAPPHPGASPDGAAPPPGSGPGQALSGRGRGEAVPRGEAATGEQPRGAERPEAATGMQTSGAEGPPGSAGGRPEDRLRPDREATTAATGEQKTHPIAGWTRVMLRRWPAGAHEDVARAVGAASRLGAAERAEAERLLDPWLAHARAHGRRHVGALVSYLDQRKWTLLPAEVAAPAGDGAEGGGGVIALERWTKPWWALLHRLALAGDWQRARAFATYAPRRASWVVRAGEVPAEAELAAMVTLACDSPQWRAWADWLAGHGVRIATRGLTWVFAPAGPPPHQEAGSGAATGGDLSAADIEALIGEEP